MPPATTPTTPSADLHWLDGPPPAPSGSTWGVPWPRGQVAKGTTFALATADGASVPVQSWPLAYWPDGSLKWTAHATGAETPVTGAFRLSTGAPAAPRRPVVVSKSGDEIRLGNGVVDVRLAAHGPTPITSITRDGTVVGHDGRLTLLLQGQHDDANVVRRNEWVGYVTSATIEQAGPVRAVVKLTGRYRLPGDVRSVLPWTLRIYLGAGDEAIRLVHHFVWDADVDHDLIGGLGLQIAVPMAEEPHNRHIRFGTVAGGIWGEPVRVLTGLRRDPGSAVRAAQIAGTATPPVDQWSQQVRDGYRQLALWNELHTVPGDGEPLLGVEADLRQGQLAQARRARRPRIGFRLRREHQRRPRLRHERLLAAFPPRGGRPRRGRRHRHRHLVVMGAAGRRDGPAPLRHHRPRPRPLLRGRPARIRHPGGRGPLHRDVAVGLGQHAGA
ncbi:hypothetical protein KUTG_09117 [Kutzneria sp. 744]|nr:hypothetical protein KUTG_09117 [Kutzneria sp. 744]